MTYCYPYPRPGVTVDLVILANQAAQMKVLLIRRAIEPFKDQWALPGGFVEEHEDIQDAAMRELKEETGLEGISMIQIGAFGKPYRDPRGHTITIAYLARIAEIVEVAAGDDAGDARWFSISDLPILAFDHHDILNCALLQKQGI